MPSEDPDAELDDDETDEAVDDEDAVLVAAAATIPATLLTLPLPFPRRLPSDVEPARGTSAVSERIRGALVTIRRGFGAGVGAALSTSASFVFPVLRAALAGVDPYRPFPTLRTEGLKRRGRPRPRPAVVRRTLARPRCGGMPICGAI